jgi:hypothetical protein
MRTEDVNDDKPRKRTVTLSFTCDRKDGNKTIDAFVEASWKHYQEQRRSKIDHARYMCAVLCAAHAGCSARPGCCWWPCTSAAEHGKWHTTMRHCDNNAWQVTSASCKSTCPAKVLPRHLQSAMNARSRGGMQHAGAACSLQTAPAICSQARVSLGRNDVPPLTSHVVSLVFNSTAMLSEAVGAGVCRVPGPDARRCCSDVVLVHRLLSYT